MFKGTFMNTLGNKRPLKNATYKDNVKRSSKANLRNTLQTQHKISQLKTWMFSAMVMLNSEPQS